MAVLTANKFIQTSGPVVGINQPMASVTWGETALGLLSNSVIAFPKVDGSANQALVTDGLGVIGYATINASFVGLGNVSNDAQIIKAIGTTKGDLIVYTASNTPVRRGVGSNGQVLTADSAETDGVKWSTVVTSPGGADTQFQYNNAGVFAGASAMVYTVASGKVTFNPTFTSTSDVEILNTVSGSLFLADVSDKAIGINGSARTAVFSIRDNGSSLLSVLDLKQDDGNIRALRIDNLAHGVGLGFNIRQLNSGYVLLENNGADFCEIKDNRTVTFNYSFEAGADFEVKKQTSGSAFFVDVSTGFIGLGTTTPASTFNVHSTTEPYIYITTATAAHRIIIGTELIAGNTVNLSAIGDMVVRHDTGAVIFNARSATGIYKFTTGTGSPEPTRLSINYEGKVIVNDAFSSLAVLQVNKVTSGIALYSEASTGYLGIGTAPSHALDILAGSQTRIRLRSGVASQIVFWTIESADADTANTSLLGDSVYRNDAKGILLTARNATGEIKLATGATDVIKFTVANGGNVAVNVGNFDISATGKGLGIKGGAVTDSIGDAVLVAGTVTIANTNILATDKIILSHKIIGGTPGFITPTIIGATSFTLTSTSVLDTSTITYQIIRTL